MKCCQPKTTIETPKTIRLATINLRFASALISAKPSAGDIAASANSPTPMHNVSSARVRSLPLLQTELHVASEIRKS